MPIGDWTPPAGWTWSDSSGWLPPSDGLRAENERLKAVEADTRNMRDAAIAEIERLRAALEQSQLVPKQLDHRQLYALAEAWGYTTEETAGTYALMLETLATPPQDSGNR